MSLTSAGTWTHAEWAGFTLIVRLFNCFNMLRVFFFKACNWQFVRPHSPGLLMSPGHERWSITCPLLPTTDSTPNKQQVLLFQTLTPPLYTETHKHCENIPSQTLTTEQPFSSSYCCVSVFGVATINDDIPGFEKRNLRKNKCTRS